MQNQNQETLTQGLNPTQAPIDWRLVIQVTAKLLAVTAFGWAVLKVVLIAQSYGGLAALVFAGLHLPLCLFSTLFVLWLFELHQGFGFLALFSALLNAVLI